MTASNQPHGSSDDRGGRPTKGQPRATILWLNFNSMKNISLIFRSLDSLLEQEYQDFEILIIDNASDDGSWDAVKQHLGPGPGAGPPLRFLETERNLGYTGGFDYGYRHRDPSSRYVAVISDDAILSRDFLAALVGAMEKDPSIGAAQGIVTTLDGSRVDSAGVLVDRFMIPHHVMRGEAVRSQGEPMVVSFVEGTCPVYRVEALRKVMGSHLFYPEGFFQYLEDNLNGLLLWTSGYRCLTLPRVVARHKREAGGGGLLRTYGLWRNRTALVRITDSRYKLLEYVFAFSSMVYLLASGQEGKARVLVKGAYDGHGLAGRLRKRGFRISLAKVPMYRLGPEYMALLVSKSRGRGRLDEMDL